MHSRSDTRADHTSITARVSVCVVQLDDGPGIPADESGFDYEPEPETEIALPSHHRVSEASNLIGRNMLMSFL